MWSAWRLIPVWTHSREPSLAEHTPDLQVIRWSPKRGHCFPPEPWEMSFDVSVFSFMWRVENYTPDMSRADVEQAVRKAFQLWSSASPLTFTKVSEGQADIMISFVWRGELFPPQTILNVASHHLQTCSAFWSEFPLIWGCWFYGLKKGPLTGEQCLLAPCPSSLVSGREV